jgi:nicotinamidase-related amidase
LVYSKAWLATGVRMNEVVVGTPFRWFANIGFENGSLAVANGRDIHTIVNDLLNLPFVIRIATKDWHPANHISFAANHEGKQPFVDFTTVVNPYNPTEAYESRLWPVHCVQDSDGAKLVPELDVSKIDAIIEKGICPEVEMYSAFYDPFIAPRVSDSGLSEKLKENDITDVYVVGLAADYCVKATALDVLKEGFRSHIVEEGTRAVDASAWPECRVEILNRGVFVVSAGGPEVAKVRNLKQQ